MSWLRRTAPRAAGLLALALFAGTTVGHPDDVKFFCAGTDSPMGDATDVGEPYYRWHYTYADNDPEVCATDLINSIVARGYTDPYDPTVAVHIEGLAYGRGYHTHQNSPPLYYAEDDDMVTAYTGGYPKSSPWDTAGIAFMQGWMIEMMDSFMAQRTVKMGLGHKVPIPSRWINDTEVPTLIGDSVCEMFMFLKSTPTPDPRWDNELLPWYGVTLAELFADAVTGMILDGTDPCNPALSIYHEDNHAFGSWIYHINANINDMVMKEAVYDVVHAYWPNCKTSDYERSLRMDGQDGRVWWENCYDHDLYPWKTDYWYGQADHQAPQTFHGVDNDFQNTMARTRHILDSMIRSFSVPPDPSTITPWFTLTDAIYPSCGDVVSYNFDETVDHLALCRAKNANEFILWNGGAKSAGGSTTAADNWDPFVDAVKNVWGQDITAYDVTQGTDLDYFTDPLDYSNNEPLSITSASDTATVEVDFDTLFPYPTSGNSMDVNVEMWISDCVGCSGGSVFTGEVYAWNYMTTPPDWELLDDTVVATNPDNPTIVSFNTVSQSYIDATTREARIKVRVFSNGPDFVANIDLVQLVRTDR